MRDKDLRANFRGVFFLTQKLLPLINDGGRIIMISTGLTRIIIPESGPYGFLKGAIEVLTKYLAKELGPRRIGRMIASLLTEDNRWINAQRIEVSGGQSI